MTDHAGAKKTSWITRLDLQTSTSFESGTIAWMMSRHSRGTKNMPTCSHQEITRLVLCRVEICLHIKTWKTKPWVTDLLPGLWVHKHCLRQIQPTHIVKLKIDDGSSRYAFHEQTMACGRSDAFTLPGPSPQRSPTSSDACNRPSQQSTSSLNVRWRSGTTGMWRIGFWDQHLQHVAGPSEQTIEDVANLPPDFQHGVNYMTVEHPIVEDTINPNWRQDVCVHASDLSTLPVSGTLVWLIELPEAWSWFHLLSAPRKLQHKWVLLFPLHLVCRCVHPCLEDSDWPIEPPLDTVENFVQQRPIQTTPNITWRPSAASPASSSSASPAALPMRTVRQSRNTRLRMMMPIPRACSDRIEVNEQPLPVQNILKFAVFVLTVFCKWYACDAKTHASLHGLRKTSRKNIICLYELLVEKHWQQCIAILHVTVARLAQVKTCELLVVALARLGLSFYATEGYTEVILFTTALGLILVYLHCYPSSMLCSGESCGTRGSKAQIELRKVLILTEVVLGVTTANMCNHKRKRSRICFMHLAAAETTDSSMLTYARSSIPEKIIPNKLVCEIDCMDCRNYPGDSSSDSFVSVIFCKWVFISHLFRHISIC